MEFPIFVFVEYISLALFRTPSFLHENRLPLLTCLHSLTVNYFIYDRIFFYFFGFFTDCPI